MNETSDAQTDNRIQAALADIHLDRIEALLDDPALDGAMRLDQIQGFLCAARSGPEPLPEEEWLPEVLGSDEALGTESGREAAGLLRQFVVALEQGLAEGEPPVLLLYAREDDENGPSDYLPWCEAYLSGVDAAAEDWFEFLGDEDDDEEDEEIAYLDERLFPMMVLTGEAAEAAKEHGETWPEGEERETLEADCQDDLPQAVTDIYRFWLAKRGISTIHRDAPKVGRNDPCPCGSGKKFKQCCGIA